MKVLFLTPRIPYPPVKGDQAVAYHRLRTLGTRHDITLLTFVEGKRSREAEAALRPFCKRIICVPHSRRRVFKNLVCGCLSGVPVQVLYFRSPVFSRQLRCLLEEDFDVVHAFMLRMRPYLEGIRQPVILECIDSMRLNLCRRVEVSRGVKRWLYREELRRISRYEAGIDKYVDRAIFVSSLDAEYSRSARALALPLGVPVSERKAECRGSVVAFSGNMSYAPNVDAVLWFVRSCWPAIRSRCPQAVFRVLGRNPASAVRTLAGEPGVEIRGEVEDMSGELQQAALAVAPMQSGSGMQFKILEAMACGLPVVASLLGLGTIAAQPGREVVVANTSDEMVSAVSGLLQNAELRREVGAAARQFVSKQHSWEDVARMVESEWTFLTTSGSVVHQVANAAR